MLNNVKRNRSKHFKHQIKRSDMLWYLLLLIGSWRSGKHCVCALEFWTWVWYLSGHPQELINLHANLGTQQELGLGGGPASGTVCSILQTWACEVQEPQLDSRLPVLVLLRRVAKRQIGGAYRS
jgi:hypothetical protein